MRSGLSLGLFALSLTLATPAFARDENEAARDAFRSAENAFKNAEYHAAAGGFERAYRLSPNGGVLFNAAMSWERAGEPARAADDFEKALASGELDEKSASEAKIRLAGLKQKLTRVSIGVPAGTRVWLAHVEDTPGPLRVHVTPGSHVARARFSDGTELVQNIQAVAGRAVDVHFDEPIARRDEREASEPADAPRPIAKDTTRVETKSSPSWPWIAIGGGVAIAAIGGYLRYQGYRANRDFEDSGETDPDARDRAIRLRTWSGVALIGGAALAATGAVFVIVDSRGRVSGFSVRLQHF